MPSPSCTILYLAAGLGNRLHLGLPAVPKACVSVGGRTVIEWLVDCADCCGDFRKVVLTGPHGLLHRWPVAEVVDVGETGNMLETMFAAPCPDTDWTIISYSDIIYEPRVLGALVKQMAAVSVVVDTQWLDYFTLRNGSPLTIAENFECGPTGVKSIGQPLRKEETPQAQYVGLLKFSREALLAARTLYQQLEERFRGLPWRNVGDFRKAFLTDFIQELADLGWLVEPCYISGGWLEIDTPNDLVIAEEVIQKGIHNIFDANCFVGRAGPNLHIEAEPK